MTANIAEVKALKECKDANNNDYVNRFHTAQDVLPIADGVMATNLTVQDQTKQYEAADLLLAALKGQNKMNLGRLNGQEYNNQAFGVLVVEPDSTKVRLLYSPELGLHPLQGKSSIGEKLLWLQGEGSYQEGPPLGIALTCDSVVEEPFKAQNTASIAVATEDQLSTGFKASNVQTVVQVMRIAPVPVFYALDAIEDPVPAIKILERIQEDPRLDSSPAMIHLNQWLHAAFVRDTVSKEKMRVSATEMATTTSREARAWARQRMEKILGPKPAPLPPAVFTAPAPAAPAPATAPPVAKKGDACPWSDDVLATIVRMCGINSVDRSGNIGLIPAWQKALWKESHQQMQNRKIVEALESNKIYEEVPTVTNPDVLDTIRGAKYFATDSHTDQSLIQAAKHLSVFSCNKWLDHEIEDYRDYEEKKEEATVLTLLDVKKKSKKAKVPDSYLGFLDLLKMYTNTLKACFGDSCTMVTLMTDLIKIIHQFHPSSRDQFYTLEHKANILWIVHLQGREWTRGTAKVLEIFKHMVQTLKWKRGFVQYIGVPKELYMLGTDKQKPADDKETDPMSPYGGSPSKAQRKEESKTRDPRLTCIDEAITKALKGAPNGKTWVPISAICKMCDYWPTKDNTQECAMYMILGQCTNKRCRRSHKDMAKTKVTEALQKFKAFLTDPDAVWKFVQ
jgi:hypothetical protein